MKIISYDKVAIPCIITKVEEAKATIVFSHGFLEQKEYYRHLSVYFAQNQFNCILYDLRGHGESTIPFDAINDIDEYLFDLLAVVQHAKSLTDDVFVIGFSLGGMISMLFATYYDFMMSGLVLLAPGIVDHKIEQSINPYRNFNAQEFFEIVLDQESHYRDAFLARIQNIDITIPEKYVHIVLGNAPKILETRKDLISNDLLWIQGIDDPVVTYKEAFDFYNSLNETSSKQWISITSHFHALLRQSHRDRILDEIIAWIKKER